MQTVPKLELNEGSALSVGQTKPQVGLISKNENQEALKRLRVDPVASGTNTWTGKPR